MNKIVTRVMAHGLTTLLAASPFLMQPAFADDTPLTPQQKMAICAKQNKGKKGDDYKQSISDCLKGSGTAAAAPPTQRQKMAICSRQNKGKKGDDYKQSVSDCLKA